MFCAAVLRAVNKFQGLLRFSIASAGNDHRLGANEAPPAIISIFLGDMLTDIFQQIEKAGSAKSTKSGGIMDIGVGVLPKLPRDAGDRNRTSPFAFTGNKFEFRAVSSNQGIAMPNVALNVAVTESLDYCATELEASLKRARSSRRRSSCCSRKVVKDSKRIIFNGNGYSDEWQKEAAKRGLLNHKTSVDAFGELLKPDVDQGVRAVRRPQRARAAGAPRGRARAVQQDHQHRGAADGADGQPQHPAGGLPVPGRARADRGGGQGRRRDAPRSHARRSTRSAS